LTLPAAGFGILMRITLHYWHTDCAPLPIADHELRNISRAHAPSWRQWKPQVLQIFADVKPALDRYFAYRTNAQQILRELGKKSAGASRLRALEKSERATKPVRTVPKRRNDANYEPAAAPIAAAGGRSRRMD